MIEWATKLLIGFISLIVGGTDIGNSQHWQVVDQWRKTNLGWQFLAISNDPNSICTTEKSKIQLPQVIHGVHEIRQSGRLIMSSGDATFAQATSFYDAPVVSCSQLNMTDPIEWKVITYSEYFARFNHFPKPAELAAASRFFNVTVNTIAAGVLIVLAAFVGFIFSGRVQRRYVLSLVIGSLMFAIYAGMTTADNLGIPISMIHAHKLADIAVWTASLAYIYFFRRFNVLGQIEFYGFAAAFAVGQALIIFGKNADTIQLGTTIPIPFAFICLASFLINSLRDGLKAKFDRHRVFSLVSIFFFSAAGMNDALHITGMIESVMIMPVASVFGVFFWRLQ